MRTPDLRLMDAVADQATWEHLLSLAHTCEIDGICVEGGMGNDEQAWEMWGPRSEGPYRVLYRADVRGIWVACGCESGRFRHYCKHAAKVLEKNELLTRSFASILSVAVLNGDDE